MSPVTDEFKDQDCITCSIRFRVPAGFTAYRRRDNRSFFCPNGHSMAFTESQADKLRRERDRLAQQIAQKDDEIHAARTARDAAEQRAAAAERKTKRVEKRAHAGLCPCCNRSFAELAKHIATKHPTFRAEEVGARTLFPS